MSINWVMLPPASQGGSGFVPLSAETTLYTSPPRTSLAISSLGKFPAHQPINLSSSSGTVYLTTKRLIYLPAQPTSALQSFSTPLMNLQDTHVTTPWIGPNVWTALLRPVSGGGLDSQPGLEVRLTFRDGGAYDFQSGFEQLRERTAQAIEAARARGQDLGGRHDGDHGRGPGVMESVNVVMEDLPRYEEASQGSHHAAHQAAEPEQSVGTGTATPATVFTPPDEPPPGYEQVQREVIEDEFSRRLSAAQLREDHETDSR